MKRDTSLVQSMRLAALAGVVMLSLAAGVSRGQAKSEPFSPLFAFRDLDNIEFEGATTFNRQALRDALSGEVRFLLASHPQAPLAEFLETLEQKVLTGYQHNGFPKAKVTAALDPDTGRVRVQISEGARFRCGKVQVAGAKAEPAAAIVARLTNSALVPSRLFQGAQHLSQHPNTATNEGLSVRVEAKAEIRQRDPRAALAATRPGSNDKPLWVPGEPASFGEAAVLNIETTAKDCLAECGFFFPKITSDMKLDTGNGTADLLVRVLDEGPQGTVSQLEVIGNQQNTREEILDFLGLKPGMAITRSRVAEAEQKLWRSARFVRYEITPEPAASGLAKATSVRLSVKVQEYDLAPKLTQPLSAEQQAMLRLCDWLSDFASRPEDLTITFALTWKESPIRFAGSFTLSPSQGALLRFENLDKPGGMDYAMLLAADTMGVYAPKRGSKLFVQQPDLASFAVISFVPAVGNPQTPFSLSMGGGFVSLTDDDRKSGAKPGFGLNLTLAPAAFLYFLEATNLLIEAKGQWLALLSSNQMLRMDAATGRLQELSIHGPDDSIDFRFAKGAFEQARREADAAAAGLSNRYDPSHPFSSLVAFGAVELARWSVLDRVVTNLAPVQRERAVAALNKLLGITVLAPLDQALGTSNPAEPFTIPADESDLALTQNSLSAFFAAFGFRYCNDFFPKYSWPWTLARESVFVLAHHATYADAELQRLYESDATGPLGCLIIAELLAKMNSPAARTFVVQGLTRLSATDFRSDCRLFLEGESGLARAFSNMTVVLREMPIEEVDALAAALPADEASFLKDCAQALRSAPAQPLAVSLRPALDKYWTQSLRARLRAALLKLRVAAPAPAGPRV
jgi:hypothetical protein